MPAISRAADEIDVEPRRAADQEHGQADHSENDRGGEPVIANPHEVDVIAVQEIRQPLVHAQLPQPAFRLPEVEQQTGHVQRGEERNHQSGREADAEPFKLIVAEGVKHDGRENAGQVSIENRRERAVVAVAQGQGQAGPPFAFFAQSLVNQHVGVNGHAQGEDKAGQSRQREGGVDEHHECDRQQQVGEQCDAGDQPGEPVIDQHE